MRRGVGIAVVLLLAGTFAASAAASSGSGFAFGRLGGDIIPFRVGVTAAGRVDVTGPVHVGRHTLAAAQRATIARVAAAARFSSLPPSTRCSGTLPDVATMYVVYGGRTVAVHGRCLPRFDRVWNAVSSAVQISY